MNRRSSRLATLAIILMVAIGLAANNVVAQGPGGDIPIAPAQPLNPSAVGTFKLQKPLTGVQRILVELSGPTLAEYSNAEGAATLEQSSFLTQAHGHVSLFAEQAAFAVAAKAAGVNWTEGGRLHTALNGIIMKVDTKYLNTIAHLPGVQKIYIEHPMYLADNADTLFVGSQAAWSRTYTGVGIKVGVIDTGVDYTHVDFGGTGVYCANPGQGTCGFPTAKVVGGYNFATDDGSVATDPLDRVDGSCGGEHGTHVAGTVAGFGVTTGGVQYTGTYNPLPAISNFNIQPGVAPNAKLYAYRVFSCTNNSSSVGSLTLAAAIDRAVSDQVNVIQMSIGGAYNNDQDPFEKEFNNAAFAGVVSAVAAGNNGDTYYVSGTSMTTSLSVAASSANGPASALASVTENSPTSAVYAGATASFGSPGPATGNLSYVPANPGDGARDACGNPPQASGGTTYLAAGSLTNKIALIDRGTCSFQTKAYFAQVAGAVGAIIVNNRPGVPQSMGGDSSVGTVTIPTVMISDVDGTTLKNAVAGGTVNVTIAPPGPGSPTTADTMAGFSSRGPGINLVGGVVAPKPDISAPGLAVTSAQAGSGNGSLTIQGTSMATPHVSGALADLKQAHPTWGPGELKAGLMNHAIHDISYGVNGALPLYGLTREGAGRLDIDAATASDSQIIAYSIDRPYAVTVSYGVIGATTTTPQTITKNVVVANKGGVAATFNVAFANRNTIPGVTYTVSPNSITVPANSTVMVAVTLNVNFAGITGPHTYDPTIALTQGGLPRNWLSEASGFINFTPVSGTTHALRLGVWASVRPSSNLHNTTSSVGISTVTGTQLSFTETGVGLYTGPTITDTLSIKMPFQLVAQYSTPPTINNVLEREAQLKYLGISNTYSGAMASAKLYFGLASISEWSSPNEMQYAIFTFPTALDAANFTNNSYVIFNSAANQPSGDPTDVFVSAVQDSAGNTLDVEYLNLLNSSQHDMQMFNSNLMVMRTTASTLGLTDASPILYYRILGFFNGVVNQQVFDSGPITYNASQPVYTFPGVDYQDYASTGPYSVNYNMNNKKLSAAPPNILLFHFHNFGAANRAEVIPISYTGPNVGVAAPNAIVPAAPTFVPSKK